MKKWYQMPKFILYLIIPALLLVGCGENRAEQGTADDTAEPIHISVELSLWSDTDLDKPRSILERVREIYPDVSIASRQMSHEELLSLLHEEQLPNIIYIASEKVTEELLAKIGDVLSRGDATIAPADMVPGGLYYNVDLFDKFGVPYPEDDMNWDDVVPMVRKLTRQEGGRQYYGFAASVRYLTLSNPWSLPLIDRDLRTATFNNELWRHWFVRMHAVFNAADQVLDVNSVERSTNLFSKEKNVAMWAGNDILTALVTATEGLHWDVVNLPSDPNISLTSETAAEKQTGSFWIVSNTAEHSEEAYLVLSYILSPSNYRNDTQYLLREMASHIKGKNISAIFKNNMKKFTLDTRILDDSIEMFARDELYKKLVQTITNQLDVNTALREAEEITNMKIQAEDST